MAVCVDEVTMYTTCIIRFNGSEIKGGKRARFSPLWDATSP